jgi:hypothetical protein
VLALDRPAHLPMQRPNSILTLILTLTPNPHPHPRKNPPELTFRSTIWTLYQPALSRNQQKAGRPNKDALYFNLTSPKYMTFKIFQSEDLDGGCPHRSRLGELSRATPQHHNFLKLLRRQRVAIECLLNRLEASTIVQFTPRLRGVNSAEEVMGPSCMPGDQS